MSRTIVCLVVAISFVVLADDAATARKDCPGAISGSGVALWWDYPFGACLLDHLYPGEPVVAMNQPQWDDAEACGRCLRITGPEGTIVARVVDLCSTTDAFCQTEGNLDLSHSAFDSIGNPGVGIVDIIWESVPCEFDGPFELDPTMVFRSGQEFIYFEFIVVKALYGVSAAEVLLDGEPPVSLTHDASANRFYTPSGTPSLTPPLTFRFTDVHGHAVVTTVPDLVTDVRVVTDVQFPRCDLVGVDDAPRAMWLLHQNVPNPFNPQTSIVFTMLRQMPVQLRVYDVSGRLVEVLLDGHIASQGRNEVIWRGRDMDGRIAPAGLYFYRLEAADRVETKRMTLLK